MLIMYISVVVGFIHWKQPLNKYTLKETKDNNLEIRRTRECDQLKEISLSNLLLHFVFSNQLFNRPFVSSLYQLMVLVATAGAVTSSVVVIVVVG